MAEKYFTTPTSAQEIAKLYEKGKEYNSSIDLSETVENNRNFYAGDQWEGLETEGLKPVILNFIRPTIQIKAASIMSEDIAMTVRPTGIPGAISKNMEKASTILTNELNRLWEKQKGTTKTRRILTACPIDGDGCWHTFWDTAIPVANVTEEMMKSLTPEVTYPSMSTMSASSADYRNPITDFITNGEPITSYNNNSNTAKEISNIDIEGDINFEQILNTRCFFGNTSDSEVQTQPWILVAGREFTASLKKRAEGGKGVSVDDIKGGTDDYFDDDQEDRTTLFTLYYRDEDTKTIWSIESTVDTVIKEATDTGLHYYPICWMNWEERLNSYHGYAAVTELVKNQLAVNVLATMAVASVSRSAFPTIIYRKDLMPDGYNNGVGSAIGVNGFADDVNSVVKVVEGANYGYQVDKLMDYLVSTTNQLNGATDATLGNVNPENTSAIIAAQKAATTPLELNRRSLYQFIEDWTRIAIDFMVNYYGERPVAVINEETNAEEIIDFDFATINMAAVDIKIDIGGSSYWSELTEVKTLDNLFLKEMIPALDYIEAIPSNLMPHKQLIMANLKAREDQTQMMQNPETAMMNNAMGMSEETPLQEVSKPSPLSPTVEDLSGVVQNNRIGATISKAENI